MATFPNPIANFGAYRFATLPPVGQSQPGDIFFTTDVGLVFNTGTAWAQVSPILATADQRLFEQALSVNGALFNGTSDDAPAIQAAFNTLGADGKIHNVAFPAGGLTATISSVNSCPYADAISASPPNTGFQIPSNVGSDFNGTTFAVSAAGATAIGATGGAMALVGNSRLTNAYPVHMLRWERGLISGNGVGYTLIMGNNVADRGPDRVTWVNMRFTGALAGIDIGKTAYAIKFQNCNLGASPGTSTLSPLIHINSTLNGEAITLVGCTLQADTQGQTVCGIQQITQSDVFCFGCSFDFLACAVQQNSTAPLSCNLFGCHLELQQAGAAYDGRFGGLGYLQINGNAAPQAINMFGGTLQVDTGGTGTNIPYLCNPATSTTGAPYGITLDRVQRTLQSGTVLNNASATGRFVDNP